MESGFYYGHGLLWNFPEPLADMTEVENRWKFGWIIPLSYTFGAFLHLLDSIYSRKAGNGEAERGNVLQ